MNHTFKTILLSFGCFLCAFYSNAQRDSINHQTANTDSTAKTAKHGYAKAYLKYLTNAVYSGRADDVATGYISPTIAYNFKQGMYVSGGCSYAIAPGISRMDNYSLEGGYSFSAFHDKFDATIGIAKYFYNDSSQNIRSVLDGAAFSYLGYEMKDLYMDGSIYASFGSGTDISLGYGIGHHFYAFDDELSISPNISMSAGTQHYYTKFVTVKKKGRKPNQQQITLTDNSRFRILDYELAVPVSFEKGMWSFTAKPIYAIPVNGVKYANLPEYSEQLKNRLYAEFEVTVKF